MKDLLITEIEDTLNRFFATATDEEFWAAVDEANNGVYSQVYVSSLIPSLCEVEKFLGTAVETEAAEVELSMFSYGSIFPLLPSKLNATANSNELALAA